jgi:hypothetical protein
MSKSLQLNSRSGGHPSIRSEDEPLLENEVEDELLLLLLLLDDEEEVLVVEVVDVVGGRG